MIKASAVDNRYGTASQGNVVLGRSKDALALDFWSLVSDPINTHALAALVQPDLRGRKHVIPPPQWPK
jgi:hypothetical protein